MYQIVLIYQNKNDNINMSQEINFVNINKKKKCKIRKAMKILNKN